MGALADPGLLKKGNLVWNESAQKAFSALKKAMVTARTARFKKNICSGGWCVRIWCWCSVVSREETHRVFLSARFLDLGAGVCQPMKRNWRQFYWRLIDGDTTFPSNTTPHKKWISDLPFSHLLSFHDIIQNQTAVNEILHSALGRRHGRIRLQGKGDEVRLPGRRCYNGAEVKKVSRWSTSGGPTWIRTLPCTSGSSMGGILSPKGC